jgi:hypothetical protein
VVLDSSAVLRIGRLSTLIQLVQICKRLINTMMSLGQSVRARPERGPRRLCEPLITAPQRTCPRPQVMDR